MVEVLLQSLAATVAVLMIWIDLLRDLWRPAISLSEQTHKEEWIKTSTKYIIPHDSAYCLGSIQSVAENLHRVSTALLMLMSRYSRYILWVPLLELYLTQMP
jgi:hypothetical protein